jgi:tetratricopeptide (TPR) repeat protein
VTLDLCVPEPVTDLAESETWIGEGASARPVSSRPAWSRLFDDGLGLLHAPQEGLDDARFVLQGALDRAPPEDERARAMILHALAQVDIRQGLTADALDRLDEAERLTPGEPSVAHARGQAYADVWRWNDAVDPLRAAALASPRDVSLFSELSVALASTGDAAAALAAASRGLALAPRDADLLRVQAGALDELGAPSSDSSQAREAFARWRPPDEAPSFKNKCAKRVPGCALERIPVHVHVLR